MKHTSLNIAGKIDPGTISVLAAVSRATGELGIPYVVVGAMARDLVLHHGHGFVIRRATRDIDLGIEVPGWDAFGSLVSRLCADGFTTTRSPQRLIAPARIPLDVVPFGQLASGDGAIRWPPSAEMEMSVLGFQEAYENAQPVRVRNEPPLDIPVAAPTGLLLLKLVAWTDRTPDLRVKDARDIAYLLGTYGDIPSVQDALYGESAAIMETYDWDLRLAGAQLLGEHVASLARPLTRHRIEALLRGTLERLTLERLVEEMSLRPEEAPQSKQLLSALARGFLEGGT